jgi:hypothetical protein
LRLLYTITSYPPALGGAQIHAHELAKCLSQGADVQVISEWHGNRTDWLLGSTLFSNGLREGYSMDGVPVKQIRFPLIDKLRMLSFVPLSMS